MRSRLLGNAPPLPTTMKRLSSSIRYYLFRADKRLSAGICASLANAVASLLLITALYSSGERVENVDFIDVFFESASVFIALITFALISFVRISVNIKAPFLLGLFLLQIGRSVDMLDELVYYDFREWSALGDGLAFFGEVFIVYAAARWIFNAYKVSMTDKLTSLYNRHYLERAFEKATLLRRSQDSNGIHLIMLDIDNFKTINDKYGHGVGDAVLVSLAELLQNNTRPSDIVARQGGEEFEILLPESDKTTALAIAERIRAAIENDARPSQPRFTASLGVSEFMQGDSIKSLRQRADFAVYEAKANGKNQVVFGSVSTESGRVNAPLKMLCSEPKMG